MVTIAELQQQVVQLNRQLSELQERLEAISPPEPSSSRSQTGFTRSSSGPRPTLSDDERKRRQAQGLCRYCGNAGHFKHNCPALNPVSNVSRLSNVNPVLSVVPAPLQVPVSHVVAPSSGNQYPRSQ